MKSFKREDRKVNFEDNNQVKVERSQMDGVEQLGDNGGAGVRNLGVASCDTTGLDR